MFGSAPYQVLNNAIDTARYSYNPQTRHQARTALGIPDNAFVVGHVGRFAPVKNHTFLIEVFSELHQKNPNSILLLVGGGELLEAVRTDVRRRGLTDSVLFTGMREDVPDLLQAMDVFLFPSRYEGLPLTLVEAQAAGLPCIISDKVPGECAVTNLVEQVSLKESVAQWAERVLARTEKVRRNTWEEIVSAGYDINGNAARLQHYYTEQWKANE